MPYYVILTTDEGCRIAGSFAIMDYSVPVFPFGYWSYTGSENVHRFMYNSPDSTYRCYWEFEDGTVLQGNEITHTMSDGNNEVELKVYDTGGNLVYSEEIRISGKATGMEEPAADAIRIYPNPVTDLLYVELGETGYGNASAVIYGIRGRKLIDIDNVNFTDGFFRFNVNELPAGLYMIRLLYEDEVLGTGKFIKSD
jgi:hypothetical protein